MALEKWAEALAQKIQEAATSLSQTDIYRRLADALRDIYSGTGRYAYICDVYGDDQSGDVVYCCDGETLRAPYTMTAGEGTAAKCEIDVEAAEDVVPRTIYEPEADEGDHLAAMESIRLGEYSEGAVPLVERFVPQAERDSASSDSFAGKGKSFPILKAGDVMAAVRSLGRAGANNHSTDTIKANIKRIAKAKGWGKYLPKSWQDAQESAVAEAGARHNKSDQQMIQTVHDHAVCLGANCGTGEGTKESTRPASDGVRLVESAAVDTQFQFRESAAISPLVKIISPGRGSSGYYTKEVLERDGPKIFKRGTLMYINHATEAEESARPEGDWTKLAAVTEADAQWRDDGPDGAALYAPAAVFSKWAAEVKEKAPYTGVSIRARGMYAESETGRPNPLLKFDESKLAPDGRPGLIGKLTSADSIDLVTKAGRDGKILLESARESAPTTQPTQEAAPQMDAAEEKKLMERLSAIEADNRKLRERAAINDAPGVLAKYFGTVTVAEGIRERVSKRILAGAIPMTESGDLDAAKLTTLVEAETKDECAYVARLSGGSFVTGMSSGTQGQAQQLTAEQKAELAERAQEERRESASLMGFDSTEHLAGVRILERGRAAFDPTYNARTARGAKVTNESQTLAMEVV